MQLRQDVLRILHAFRTEGTCKSVQQLRNIGSMCMTALSYSNLSGTRAIIKHIVLGKKFAVAVPMFCLTSHKQNRTQNTSAI